MLPQLRQQLMLMREKLSSCVRSGNSHAYTRMTADEDCLKPMKPLATREKSIQGRHPSASWKSCENGTAALVSSRRPVTAVQRP